MLTGRVKVNGIILGFPSAAAPGEAWWEDEAIYREYDDGRREVVTPRWRLVGRFGWRALTATQFAQLKGMTSRPFELVLRSRAEGDSETWPELEVLVRRTGVTEEARPLGRRVRGDVAYDVLVEFEAVGVLDELPGAIEGGFALVGAGLLGSYPTYDIEPWGDATLTPEVVTRIVDGVARQLTIYRPGPPALVPLVLSPHPTNALGYWLDTTGNWRLGLPMRDANDAPVPPTPDALYPSPMLYPSTDLYPAG